MFSKDNRTVGAGQTFRLVLPINDSDEPGADLQSHPVWPATYRNFGPFHDGAMAILG